MLGGGNGIGCFAWTWRPGIALRQTRCDLSSTAFVLERSSEGSSASRMAFAACVARRFAQDVSRPAGRAEGCCHGGTWRHVSDEPRHSCPPAAVTWHLLPCLHLRTGRNGPDLGVIRPHAALLSGKEQRAGPGPGHALFFSKPKPKV